MLEPETRYVQLVAALATIAAGTIRSSAKNDPFIVSFSNVLKVP
jgi:hypothetical protein